LEAALSITCMILEHAATMIFNGDMQILGYAKANMQFFQTSML
jgi:hypothetical protein